MELRNWNSDFLENSFVQQDIRLDIKEIIGMARNWMESIQDTVYWRAFVIAALELLVP